MVDIKKHPNKEIRAAIEYAKSEGWIFEESSGHPFGRLRCGTSDDEHKTHQLSVWSTPKSAEVHARQIRKKVDQCS